VYEIRCKESFVSEPSLGSHSDVESVLSSVTSTAPLVPITELLASHQGVGFDVSVNALRSWAWKVHGDNFAVIYCLWVTWTAPDISGARRLRPGAQR